MGRRVVRTHSRSGRFALTKSSRKLLRLDTGPSLPIGRTLSNKPRCKLQKMTLMSM